MPEVDEQVEPEAEVWTEVEPEAAPEEAHQHPQPQVVYVYAIAMMTDGEVKVFSQLPFSMQRLAVPSDIVMTSQYVVDVMKAGKLRVE